MIALDPLGVTRTFELAPLSSTFFKVTGIVAVAAGLGGFTWFSSTDPKGIARRVAVAYVSRMNAELKSMFKPPIGEQMAWLQGCGALALLAMYGVIDFTPLKTLSDGWRSLLIYAAGLALIVPPIVLLRTVAQRRQRLDDQVHGFALALANALKTTASIGDALWVTVSVSGNPLKEELEMTLKQVRIGSTLEEALLAMAARTQSMSLDIVTSALLIGRQMGGDLPRILDGTSGSLRELKRLEELTERVTRTAKQSLAVAALIVGALAFCLPRFMPGFFDPIRDTLKGQVFAAQAACVYLLALYLGYRFTRLDI